MSSTTSELKPVKFRMVLVVAGKIEVYIVERITDPDDRQPVIGGRQFKVINLLEGLVTRVAKHRPLKPVFLKPAERDDVMHNARMNGTIVTPEDPKNMRRNRAPWK